MRLHDIKPAKGSKKRPKRVGRGPGSGQGKTAGRGSKGQKSRRGYSSKRGFEGGQMPLHRRIPKRGFKNLFRVEFRVVNVGRLKDLEPGSIVTPEFLETRGFVKKGNAPIKILGSGELPVALTVQAHGFSEAAARKIEAAGGSVERIVPVGSRS